MSLPATVQRRNNESVTGIEPTYRPWQGRVLPLNYTDISANRAERSNSISHVFLPLTVMLDPFQVNTYPLLDNSLAAAVTAAP